MQLFFPYFLFLNIWYPESTGPTTYRNLKMMMLLLQEQVLLKQEESVLLGSNQLPYTRGYLYFPTKNQQQTKKKNRDCKMLVLGYNFIYNDTISSINMDQNSQLFPMSQPIQNGRVELAFYYDNIMNLTLSLSRCFNQGLSFILLRSYTRNLRDKRFGLLGFLYHYCLSS